MGLRFALAATVAAVLAIAPPAMARDEVVSSFDGTPIVLHWFPQPDLAPGAQAPTVLMGPGWGSPGDVNVAGTGGAGGVGIATLHRAGYNVLTWDPRGFGRSGGTIEVDSPAFEGRDAQMLLDWVAAQPEARLDKPGDPRVGMVGGSYGGGIQLVLATLDRRVDAIVPTIAWHSLSTSLYKEQIVKSGWAGLLFASAANRNLDPHIKSAYDQGVAAGALTADNIQWFRDRGPADLVSKITAPTMLVQGTVDTLFTLDEAVTNYRLLRRHRVPVKMLWYCGGHGVCLSDPGSATRVPDATIAWLDRYVKGETSVGTGPRFDWIDQHGREFTARDYPPRPNGRLVARGRGVLSLVKEGGAGPVKPRAGSDLIATASTGIAPARAANAVNVRLPRARRAASIVGAPRVRLTYRGTAGPGDRPTRVFAQLVDEATGDVLGNQIVPIAVTLDGRRHTVARNLELVAHTLRRGERVTLQLVATTVAYAEPRLGGRVRFDDVRLTLPLVR